MTKPVGRILVLLFALSALAHGEPWMVVKNGNLTIYGRNPVLIERMLTVSAWMDHLWPERATAIRVPRDTVTVIIADKDTYSRFGSITVNRLSFFVRTTDKLYIVLGPQVNDSELIHEYTHYLVAQRFGTSTPWVDEGLSVAFSTLTQNGDSLKVSHSNPYDTGLPRCRGNITLDELLQESSISNSSLHRVQEFYRTSGRFVNYLFEKLGIGPTISMLRGIAMSPTSVDQVAKVLGESPSSLRKSFAGFCGADISVDVINDAADLTGVTAQSYSSLAFDIPQKRIDAVLAELSVRSPSETGSGMDYYQAILALHPNDQSAQEGLGIGFTLLGDYAKALGHFEKVKRIERNGTWEIYQAIACQHVAGCDSLKTSEKSIGTHSSENEEDDDSPVLGEVSSQWACTKNCPKPIPR